MLPERYNNMSIRKGDYKLVGHTNFDASIEEFELYNLKQDPDESDNLVEVSPEIAKALKADLDNWFEEQVIKNRNPRKVYLGLNPEKEDTLLLTRNELKGPPEIWTRDVQYGYWDVKVEKAGYYDVLCQFHETATKAGRLIVKQHPIQYAQPNEDPDVSSLVIRRVYLNVDQGPLEVYYKTGWNEIMIPFTVKVWKSDK